MFAGSHEGLRELASHAACVFDTIEYSRHGLENTSNWLDFSLDLYRPGSWMIINAQLELDMCS